MNKKFILMGTFALGLTFMTSCKKDDDNKIDNSTVTTEQAQNLDYTTENSKAWTNYAVNVAKLIQQDSEKLYNEWNGGFAADFKSHSANSGYASANACVQQIVEGCIDIANEVGTAKIGEPVDYWNAGKQNQALYAVESWYSWHSRDDYKNNILSIANSFIGQIISGSPADLDYHAGIANNSLTQYSIIVACMKNNALREKSVETWQNICNAWNAIDAIPQPFRNNIGSKEASAAMDACANLVKSLEELNGLISENLTEDECQQIVNQFVDAVALPTYKDLADKNKALYDAVFALQQNPSNAAFEKACQAWLNARQPWETSEAFLFGPVSDLGLDPNMDSWPLDAVGIYNLLKSQNWSEMNWSGEYDEESEAIEAAQSVRGFHTLEFLLFKNGNPRTIK